MFFLMECHHHPGVDEKRDALRAVHRDWVRSGGNGLASVLVGSAMWDDAGRGIGHFGILESASEEDARAFADRDPFTTEGIVSETRLVRLADTFPADRISSRLTAGGG